MAILKCKMCGGNLDVSDNQSYGTCDSCGSTMTLPKVDDERIVNLFNRANHYRRQNEFDKALATYESILTESTENAEAHWGCVLSKFGIEYVDDGRTRERIPTCHRVQNESILADLDYQNALRYAPDNHSAEIYKAEAERISEIQKGILSVARNEKPYDIFICYKETDESGKRTIDSSLAQDIYYQLTNEGYKVFFSRITLEDKLGQEYEPYIFAALNSAKVMLVVGTKSEYFNAVWVKNEWARFLDIIKKDRSKLIIPCYRDMDAYDLPDELSMFQSQDMSKIGFIQDLIRGVSKVLSAKTETTNATVIQQTHDYGAEADALLKRAFLLLEEAEWKKADEFLEQVLNITPENAQAYLGKLLIEVKVNKEENLANRAIDLRKCSNYGKTIRFADAELQKRLEEYASKAKSKLEENEKKRQQKEYEEEQMRANAEKINNTCILKLDTAKKEVNKIKLYYFFIILALGIVTFIYGIDALNYMVSSIGFFAGFMGGSVTPLIFATILWSALCKNPFVTKPVFETETDCDKFIQDKMTSAKRAINKVGIIGIVVVVILLITAYYPKIQISNVNDKLSKIETYTSLLNNKATTEDVNKLLNGFGEHRSWSDSIGVYLSGKYNSCAEFYFDNTNTLSKIEVDFGNIFANKHKITLQDLERKFGSYVYNKRDNRYEFKAVNGCTIYFNKGNGTEWSSYDSFYIEK